jgi:hypothetical protein
MLPIPLSLAANPLLWDSAMLILSNALIKSGARNKVISSLTGIVEKRVRAMTHAILPPEDRRGPCQLPTPKTLVGVGYRRNYNVNLHSARLLAIYINLEKRFSEPMHEGFLLLAAYQMYKATVKEHELSGGPDQHDMNRAYALLRSYQAKEIVMERCAKCEVPYVRLNWFEAGEDACPICQKVKLSRAIAEHGRKNHFTRKKKLP